MDTLTLSRLQFAVATIYHFLFVPLTLGLSVLIALMETKFASTGDEEYRRMAKFWGKLFLINFAIGIVTGITLEFQFGTNWAGYSKYVGDIFGSLLAIEATAAFFLESTFIAVWAFGWKKLSPKAHATVIWLVAIASNLSAVWILIANSWMQHPIGYVIRNGRAELTDFIAVVTQPFALLTIAHTVFGAFVLSGFFVMGISAWHLLKGNEISLFRKSFATAAKFSLVFVLCVMAEGHLHGNIVAAKQPAKAAAMEAHWETKKNAPLCLATVPDVAGERNAVDAICIPNMLSVLMYNDPSAEVRGIKDFPKEDRPPVLITFLSFRIMVGLGMLLAALAALAVISSGAPEKRPLLMRILVFAIPLPYITNEFGWMLTEMGRQPWIVYGVMRTKDAVSNIPAANVALSLAGFVIVYTLLAVVNFSLLYKNAVKGPAAE